MKNLSLSELSQLKEELGEFFLVLVLQEKCKKEQLKVCNDEI